MRSVKELKDRNVIAYDCTGRRWHDKAIVWLAVGIVTNERATAAEARFLAKQVAKQADLHPELVVPMRLFKEVKGK